MQKAFSARRVMNCTQDFKARSAALTRREDLHTTLISCILIKPHYGSCQLQSLFVFYSGGKGVLFRTGLVLTIAASCEASALRDESGRRISTSERPFRTPPVSRPAAAAFSQGPVPFGGPGATRPVPSVRRTRGRALASPRRRSGVCAGGSEAMLEDGGCLTPGERTRVVRCCLCRVRGLGRTGRSFTWSRCSLSVTQNTCMKSLFGQSARGKALKTRPDDLFSPFN